VRSVRQSTSLCPQLGHNFRFIASSPWATGLILRSESALKERQIPETVHRHFRSRPETSPSQVEQLLGWWATQTGFRTPVPLPSEGVACAPAVAPTLQAAPAPVHSIWLRFGYKGYSGSRIDGARRCGGGSARGHDPYDWSAGETGNRYSIGHRKVRAYYPTVTSGGGGAGSGCFDSVEVDLATCTGRGRGKLPGHVELFEGRARHVGDVPAQPREIQERDGLIRRRVPVPV
jgi:hypothetical protein